MKLFIYLLLNCSSYFYLSTKLLFLCLLKFVRSIGNIKCCIKRHITSWWNCFRYRHLPINYISCINVEANNSLGAEIAEVYLEPCQVYKIVLFAKIVNGFQSLTIFAKSSIFKVWQSFWVRLWTALLPRKSLRPVITFSLHSAESFFLHVIWLFGFVWSFTCTVTVKDKVSTARSKIPNQISQLLDSQSFV